MQYANEARLSAYEAAARQWVEAWPALQRSMRELDLLSAHDLMVERALQLLPFAPVAPAPGDFSP